MKFINADITKLDNAIIIFDENGGVLFTLDEKLYFIRGEIIPISCISNTRTIDKSDSTNIKFGELVTELEELTSNSISTDLTFEDYKIKSTERLKRLKEIARIMEGSIEDAIRYEKDASNRMNNEFDVLDKFEDGCEFKFWVDGSRTGCTPTSLQTAQCSNVEHHVKECFDKHQDVFINLKDLK